MKLTKAINQLVVPEVSVITPCYNSVRYMAETVLSVINQTFENWEMIVIDDGCTDGTIEMLQQQFGWDSRIKIIKNLQRKGQVAARNSGLEVAQGRFLCFLDSDDTWHSNKLELQLNFMKKFGCEFSHGHYDLIDENGRFLESRIKAPAQLSYQELLCSNQIGCLTVMLDRDLLNAKNVEVKFPDVGKRDDWALWLRILREANISAFGLAQSIANYRLRKNSLSSSKSGMLKYNWRILREQESLTRTRAFYYFSHFALVKSLKYMKIKMS